MGTDALTAFLACDFPRADAALTALSTSTPDLRVPQNRLVTELYATLTASAADALLLFVAAHLPDPPASAPLLLSRVARHPSICRPLQSVLGPVALYNAAVVAYAAAAPASAAALAAPLYANVEALDDGLALRTCFLLIDVYLRLSDVSRAAAVAAYAERLLPSFARPVESTAVPSSSEIAQLSPDWPGRAKAALDAPVSYEDAKFCMHIYNARLSAVHDGTRNIRKEAKSAVLAADDTDNRPTAAALLVKARVEQNLAKSLRILASIGSQCPPHILRKIRPLTLNSLGILHHRLGRHCVAACYFEHSRRAFVDLFNDDIVNGDANDACQKVHLTVFSSVKDTHVCYNLAVQNMKLGDYSRALELFTVSARADTTLANDSPLLWIRMAECCIGLEASGAQNRQLLAVEGQGRGRRMIMRSEEKDEGLGMEYATTCARGAIAILDRKKDEGQITSSDAPKGRMYASISGSGSRQSRSDTPDIQTSQLDAESELLRGAALCLLAYSSLSFDAQSALDACDQLIKLYPQAENERGILGRLYSAEALSQLGRADEAANRLAPLVALSSTAENNFKEAACINMALSHISNDDMPAASRAAKVALKVAVQKQHAGLRKQASFVAAYVFLRSGEHEMAQQVLRSLQNMSA